MDIISIIMLCLVGAALVGFVAWAIIYFIFFSEKKEKIYITALRTEGDSTYIVDYYVKQKKDKLTYTKKVSEKVYKLLKVGRAYTVRIKGRKIDAVLKESVK